MHSVKSPIITPERARCAPRPAGSSGRAGGADCRSAAKGKGDVVVQRRLLGRRVHVRQSVLAVGVAGVLLTLAEALTL